MRVLALALLLAAPAAAQQSDRPDPWAAPAADGPPAAAAPADPGRELPNDPTSLTGRSGPTLRQRAFQGAIGTEIRTEIRTEIGTRIGVPH